MVVALCPELLSAGHCSQDGCAFRHDAFECAVCARFYTSQAQVESHLRGKKHMKALKGFIGTLYCTLCDRTMGGHGWLSHINGQAHARTAQERGVSPAVEPLEATLPGHRRCTVCRRDVGNHRWDAHVQTPQHKASADYAKFHSALETAEADRNGVLLDGDFDFDVVNPNDTVRLSCSVKKTINAAVRVVRVELASSKSQFRSPGFTPRLVGTGNITVPFDDSLRIEVEFHAEFLGIFEDRLEVVFEDVQLMREFVIVRAMRASVGDRATFDALKPTTPYIPRKRVDRTPETEVVEGPKPEVLDAIAYIGKLPRATIPLRLHDVLSRGKNGEIVGHLRGAFLPRTFDTDGYSKHFKCLLWAEEYRSERDLEIYDIEDAVLKRQAFSQFNRSGYSTGRQDQYYYLDVPGLAEKRPSVLIGDSILVQKAGDTTGRWYEGRVHVVRQVEVGLKFHTTFGWSAAQRYTVRFRLNRIPLRRQHQALDTVFDQPRMLFPEIAHISSRPQPTATGIRTYNALIGTNGPQLQAVASIVKMPKGSLPFVVFGPPGTGKTVTIVEAILQVLRANPNARIIACAPSNSAADLIASRLTSLSDSQLFRFYAPSRHPKEVPHELRKFTCVDDPVKYSGHFKVHPVQIMKRFRVVVTTCVSASIFMGRGIPRGHYSHIFIDEAGQATEPEAMIAIKTMADNNTNVILSGDPQQLGPMIRSRIASQLGLETSFIERLMQREVYDQQTGYGKSVVKLTKNYRSHDSILRFPNERFYRGELQPCGSPKTIDSYIGWPELPNKRFPIVFHAISGKDDREASSPSFFNIHEALQVKGYVEKLKQARSTSGFRARDDDIGVIAPYHAQCVKIRKALASSGAEQIKVGSVEEFQGQERRVIIISTVRSSQEFVQYDLRHTLGFVANPRRFNVSVTRAKSLLIIIGDPNVLSLDPLWRSFLHYIHVNGGWTGGLSWDQVGKPGAGMAQEAIDDMNDFTRRMEELTLASVPNGEEGEADDGAIDRPWRDAE
ncbi:P-loop containing nucleoside triphosphate hydrolase protein [Schizophyllum amplum]|uniref:RNA helicase n=1 Tax=Schizophyllum amplum TaxID=97359 RepID=A0A550C6C4_9AGAR|nr:P-loop containing nucleoside triphosphate hydrolase protein [Auriculariopsis ampla]